MATINAGPWSDFSKKLGKIVARQHQGRTILSVYQPNVANPRTVKQVTARDKFKVMTRFMSGMAGFLKFGFHSLDGYKYGNPYSAAVGFNLRKGNVVVQDPSTQEWEVDYTLAQVAIGNVDLPYSPSATADGTSLSVTWSDNSGMGNAETDDKVMIVAFNPTKGQSVYTTNLAERNERTGVFTLPTAWTGDTVNVWMAMYREKSNEASNSIHLASLTL